MLCMPPVGQFMYYTKLLFPLPIVTPIDDHMGPATIFEESSAESCVEQHNSDSSNYFKNPNPTESRLAGSISNLESSSSMTSGSSTLTPANQGTFNKGSCF